MRGCTRPLGNVVVNRAPKPNRMVEDSWAEAPQTSGFRYYVSEFHLCELQKRNFGGLLLGFDVLLLSFCDNYLPLQASAVFSVRRVASVIRHVNGIIAAGSIGVRPQYMFDLEYRYHDHHPRCVCMSLL